MSSCCNHIAFDAVCFPGLELLVRGATVADDQWVSAPDIDGGLVVQLGQMMQRLTNDVYLATPHRVVLPPTGTVPQRMSVVMFFRPGLEVVINPPASLVDRHKNALGYAYEPITVAEFLTVSQHELTSQQRVRSIVSHLY
eukprot:SAG31_NODE_14_length_37953_cov_109.719660_6_plen_140_part_00